MLTLSALVKPEKSLFFLERIAVKWFDRLTIPSKVEGKHKMHKRDKKPAKKALFLATLLLIEIRTLPRIISLKRAEFLVLTGIAVFGC